MLKSGREVGVHGTGRKPLKSHSDAMIQGKHVFVCSLVYGYYFFRSMCFCLQFSVWILFLQSEKGSDHSYLEKERQQNCGNYQGITLFSRQEKFLTLLLLLLI